MKIAFCEIPPTHQALIIRQTAEDRTRTGTGSPPQDFKSCASAIPPPRHAVWVLLAIKPTNYIVTRLMGQVNMRAAAFWPGFLLSNSLATKPRLPRVGSAAAAETAVRQDAARRRALGRAGSPSPSEAASRHPAAAAASTRWRPARRRRRAAARTAGGAVRLRARPGPDRRSG